ncbi:TerC family protein [Steroidobacter sp. S1-65]|uniref:TerC family protein n=1 Tax=Steroidobacter gossypii TaxID=2805490 RepID=A0ABS1X0K8_9GAMM|nr:TerC family protein [Steroidobacter gossypii]MBM0106747.1 TerC family protein [Steroidobacter gossypii]
MSSVGTPLLWSLFGVFVLVAIAIDFFALNRQGAHKVSMREALVWSLIWIAASAAFATWLWWQLSSSPDAAIRAVADTKLFEFITGYLVEKALAVDNVFVFLMVFTYFSVPAEFQKRVLMIGILGAIVLRAAMILIGAWMIARFHWILYLFGAFLVFTGIKMWWAAGQEPDLDSNPALNWLRRHMPVAPDYDGERLVTTVNGARVATPLALVVLLIGIVDVVFAVDSIPAIFAITTDPFIVLTSNVFAILGLRALYFLFAGMHERFHLLSYGLAIVLLFIGAKMLLIDVYKIPVAVSLAVTAAILAVSMLLSLWIPPSERPRSAYPFSRKRSTDSPSE